MMEGGHAFNFYRIYLRAFDGLYQQLIQPGVASSSTSEQSQLERAKAICNGRASQTQVNAGRLWIAGAIASNSTFKGRMAEQGYVQ
ncbi:hypothetical protein ABIC60_003285 [Phyllobacterium ifriqiyense]